MRDMIPDGRELSVIGLCNDAMGYILPDNDYGSVIAKTTTKRRSRREGARGQL